MMVKRKEKDGTKASRRRKLLTSGALMAYETLKKSPELRRKLMGVVRRKREAGADQPRIKCPHCGSSALHLVQIGRRRFATKRALGGALLLGWPGLLLGLTGPRGGRSQWICQNCGRTFWHC